MYSSARPGLRPDASLRQPLPPTRRSLPHSTALRPLWTHPLRQVYNLTHRTHTVTPSVLSGPPSSCGRCSCDELVVRFNQTSASLRGTKTVTSPTITVSQEIRDRSDNGPSEWRANSVHSWHEPSLPPALPPSRSEML